MVRPTVLPLKKGEIKTVREFAAQTKSSREFKRAQAVLYKSRGMSSSQIAQLLGLHLRTVQRIVRRYEKRGIESFKPKPGKRPCPKFAAEAKEKLFQAALESPRLFGFLKNNWSLEMLRLYLKKETGIDISQVHIWRVLRKHGIVYKRPKLVAPGKRGKGAKKVQNYKKVAKALLKKGDGGLRGRNMGRASTHTLEVLVHQGQAARDPDARDKRASEHFHHV